MTQENDEFEIVDVGDQFSAEKIDVEIAVIAYSNAVTDCSLPTMSDPGILSPLTLAWIEECGMDVEEELQARHDAHADVLSPPTYPRPGERIDSLRCVRGPAK